MDHETISRKEKIERARRLSGSKKSAGYQNDSDLYPSSFASRFFLRMLLSIFLFLAVLTITKFQAMGETKADDFRGKIHSALISQQGVERIKGEMEKMLK